MIKIPKIISNYITNLKNKIETKLSKNIGFDIITKAFQIFIYFNRLYFKALLKITFAKFIYKFIKKQLAKKFDINSNGFKRVFSGVIMLILFLIVFFINSKFLYSIVIISIFVTGFVEWKNIVLEKYFPTDIRYKHWLIMGAIYLIIPYYSLISILNLEDSRLIYFMCSLVIITDISAYVFGKKYGKKKIMPKVSPNKTIVGSVAAVTSCFLAGILFSIFILKHNIIHFHSAAFIAMIISIFSQLGDFWESGVKRHFGVKDSSNLIPGHGGVLDRLDGFLFAIPITLLLHNYILL